MVASSSVLADARMEALKSIDRGDYNRAIEILTGLLNSRPFDRTLRVQLASAYAARAGLKLDSYIGLARELVDSSRDLEKLYEDRIAGLLKEYKHNARTQSEVDAVETLDRIYRTSFRLANLIRQFRAIPVLRKPLAIADLKQAVSILAVEPELVGGAALYRALLRVTVVRSSFETDQRILQARNCRIQYGPAMAFITDLHQDVRGVLLDLGRSTSRSSRKSEMEKATQNLDKSVNELTERARAHTFNGEIDIREVIFAFGGRC